MIEKQSTPKGKTVKVKFELPSDVAEKSVAVAGDFNDWSTSKHKMKLDKAGKVWSTTISLNKGASFQFRYFVDEREWRNDEQADGYTHNPYFSENGLLHL